MEEENNFKKGEEAFLLDLNLTLYKVKITEIQDEVFDVIIQVILDDDIKSTNILPNFKIGEIVSEIRKEWYTRTSGIILKTLKEVEDKRRHFKIIFPNLFPHLKTLE